MELDRKEGSVWLVLSLSVFAVLMVQMARAVPAMRSLYKFCLAGEPLPYLTRLIFGSYPSVLVLLTVGGIVGAICMYCTVDSFEARFILVIVVLLTGPVLAALFSVAAALPFLYPMIRLG